MATIEVIAPVAPREQLAQQLYETMERLAPGSGVYVEWSNLSQWWRDLYLNCIDGLLDEPELVRRAINLADHDVIKGGLHEGKELYVNHQICSLTVHRAPPCSDVMKDGLRGERG